MVQGSCIGGGRSHNIKRCRGVTYPESYITNNATYTKIEVGCEGCRGDRLGGRGHEVEDLVLGVARVHRGRGPAPAPGLRFKGRHVLMVIGMWYRGETDLFGVWGLEFVVWGLVFGI